MELYGIWDRENCKQEKEMDLLKDKSSQGNLNDGNFFSAFSTQLVPLLYENTVVPIIGTCATTLGR